MYCYLIKPYRLRTPSVVQAQFDDKGRYVVGQTTVPEHNLQKTRAKKRKEESVQNMYNQILKQQVLIWDSHNLYPVFSGLFCI